MVTVITLYEGMEVKLEHRGNFIKTVNTKTKDAKVSFLTPKGQTIILDYDVQAAVIDLHIDGVGWRNIATIRGDELMTLRKAVQMEMGKVDQLEADRQKAVGTGNISLGGFVAWAERVKGLWKP